ncbi:hypothetical protein [uncultured Flavonifractor sp.]|uniref:hypothetical protein n=1 Tax=uncultured Flavonifractor sp. TaxID=1193534 RepID=UPI002592D9E0|nr:hypothetical protein [uncultured Flavonifractor sp.]
MSRTSYEGLESTSSLPTEEAANKYYNVALAKIKEHWICLNGGDDESSFVAYDDSFPWFGNIASGWKDFCSKKIGEDKKRLVKFSKNITKNICEVCEELCVLLPKSKETADILPVLLNGYISNRRSQKSFYNRLRNEYIADSTWFDKTLDIWRTKPFEELYPKLVLADCRTTAISRVFPLYVNINYSIAYFIRNGTIVCPKRFFLQQRF